MPSPSEPIAIVGMSAAFAGSRSVDEFWQTIVEARDAITNVPEGHWRSADYCDRPKDAMDRILANRGGFVPSIAFDPMEWAMPPNALAATDTVQLLALVMAKAALSDTLSFSNGKVERARTGCVLGVAAGTELIGQMSAKIQRPVWRRSLVAHGLDEASVESICDSIFGSYPDWTEATFPGLLSNVVAGRIANRLDLGGINCTVDAACASAAAAVMMAARSLALQECDLVLTGGCDALNDPFMYMCFSRTPALSATGDCRPFSDQADGTILGEGFGIVALRRLSDAERDGDHIYAVIRGIGASSDGAAKSVYAPRSGGQALALQRAYEQSGFGPETVELIEAHGTGTKAGDAAEFEGLRQVFDGVRAERRWCALGSVKSQIGHTKSAAAAASLIKAALAVNEGVLPPTIKARSENPNLGMASSAFHLPHHALPWIKRPGEPRRAGVSSFGFGGTNFHLTVEEYLGPAARAPRAQSWPTQLFLASADSQAGLIAKLKQLAAQPARAAVARASQLAFSASAAFRAAIAPTRVTHLQALADELVSELEADAAASPEKSDARGYAAARGPVESGKLCFLFPGQGSQYVGMGRDLAISFSVCRTVWDESTASDDSHLAGVWRSVFPLPAADERLAAEQRKALTRTDNAQPAIALASLAQLALLQKLGISADAAIGHSFGELTALHCAGAIPEASTLLQLALARGRCMASPGLGGAMTAVVDSADRVRSLMAELDVVIANYNAPRQTVAAGSVDAIGTLEARMKSAGVAFRRLDVAAAFHSPIFEASAAVFAEELQRCEFAAPRLDVYSNVSGERVPGSGAKARDLLAIQMTNPVRFAQQIEAALDDGVRTFLEVGPGHVLSRLTREIAGSRDVRVVAMDAKDLPGVTALWRALAQLALNGVAFSTEALWQDVGEERDPRSENLSKATVQLNGSNVGKDRPVIVKHKPMPLPQPTSAQLSAPFQRTAPRAAAALPEPATLPAPQLSSPVVEHNGQAAVPASLLDLAMGTADSVAPRRARAYLPETLEGPAVERPSSRVYDLFAGASQAHARFLETHAAVAAHHQIYLQTLNAVMLGGSQVASDSAEFRAREPALASTTWVSPPSPVPFDPPHQPEPPRFVDFVRSSAPPSDERVEQPAVQMALPVAPEAARHTSAGEPAAAPPNTAQLTDELLAVVAEKTGYPPELLDLDAPLESGLGIDSIKRVEILSTLQARWAGLATQDTAVLAGLRTLREILELVRSASDAPASPAAVPAPPAPPAVDLTRELVALVAEKTGYPPELLDLDAPLESGLGIDSIKRVEILSALQQRFPEVSTSDTSALASLRTLREIAEYFERSTGHQASQAPNSSPPVTSPPMSSSAAKSVAVGSLAVVCLEAQPQVAMGGGLCFSEPIAILDGGSGIGIAVAESLGQAGLNVAFNGAASTLLLVTESCADDVVAQGVLTFERLRAYLEAAAAPTTIVVVEVGNGGLGWGRGNTWSLGAAGLAKTVAREYPGSAWKFIDVERGQRSDAEVGRAIAHELLGGGCEAEVGLAAAGTRSVLGATRVDRETAAKSPRSLHGVWLISGGARGVTASCVRQLVRRHPQLKLGLLGRADLLRYDAELLALDEAPLRAALIDRARQTGSVPRPADIERQLRAILGAAETRRNLEALRALGTDFRYLPVDVGDAQQLERAVAQIRDELGPITGLVHAAGVIADKRIVEKSSEDFRSVFQTKVHGFENLLRATERDPIDTVCCFSSITARVGNAGQSDYAMANEVLNRLCLAQALERPQARVCALGWGPWDGGMVDPRLAGLFRERGAPLIGLDEGASCFVDLVSMQRDASEARRDVVYVIGGFGQAATGADPVVSSLDVGTLRLGREFTPSMEDHAIKGRPVAPAAWILELLRRLATSTEPVEIAGFQVVRGIVLDQFESEPTKFKWRLSPAPDGAQHFVLDDAQGAIRYRASLQRPGLKTPELGEASSLKGLTPWDVTAAGLYEEGIALFHGPRFRVLSALEGQNGHGGTARLDLSGLDGLPPGVGVLDGALQLACAWIWRHRRMASLPTRIERISIAAPLERAVWAELRVLENRPMQVVADVVLFDAERRMVGMLQGLEGTLLPGSSAEAEAANHAAE